MRKAAIGRRPLLQSNVEKMGEMISATVLALTQSLEHELAGKGVQVRAAFRYAIAPA